MYKEMPPKKVKKKPIKKKVAQKQTTHVQQHVNIRIGDLKKKRNPTTRTAKKTVREEDIQMPTYYVMPQQPKEDDSVAKALIKLLSNEKKVINKDLVELNEINRDINATMKTPFAKKSDDPFEATPMMRRFAEDVKNDAYFQTPDPFQTPVKADKIFAQISKVRKEPVRKYFGETSSDKIRKKFPDELKQKYPDYADRKKFPAPQLYAVLEEYINTRKRDS